MKVKIWVVTGSSGEYSDRTEWNVCAYISEKHAQEHSANAQAKANIFQTQYKNSWEIPKGANEYDPYMGANYTGTSYTVNMVELWDAPDGLAAWVKLQQ